MRRVRALLCLVLVLAVAGVGLVGSVQPEFGQPEFGQPDTGSSRAEDRPAPARPASAERPPMGWNSWNTFGCDIDEGKIRGVADALVRSGMRDAGYRTVVVDDCWYSPERDSAGNLRADPRRFPSGMAALGDYLHARGFGFGLYMSPNARTCAQQAGSYPGATGSGDRERRDARTFASWGVDYLKYDWCFGAGSPAGIRAAFATTRDALAETGRPVLLGINPNSNARGQPGEVEEWSDFAHTARTTEDIAPVWTTGNRNAHPVGVREIIDINAELTGRTRPGYFNDPDMLEVGVRGESGSLTPAETRTHMSMWAMLAAPLIAGNDPRTMTEADRRVLTRREVVDVNQDPLARSATRMVGGDHQVWAKPLHDGTAVALYNRSDKPADISTDLRELGLEPGSYRVRDLWDEGRWTTGGPVAAHVPAHGTALLRLEPERGGPA